MSSVATVVQYPLPCPECKHYTSKPAIELKQERRATCRVCGESIRVSDQQLESLERTISYLDDCGMRKQVSQEDEIADNKEKVALIDDALAGA